MDTESEGQGNMTIMLHRYPWKGCTGIPERDTSQASMKGCKKNLSTKDTHGHTRQSLMWQLRCTYRIARSSCLSSIFSCGNANRYKQIQTGIVRIKLQKECQYIFKTCAKIDLPIPFCLLAKLLPLWQEQRIPSYIYKLYRFQRKLKIIQCMFNHLLSYPSEKHKCLSLTKFLHVCRIFR